MQLLVPFGAFHSSLSIPFNAKVVPPFVRLPTTMSEPTIEEYQWLVKEGAAAIRQATDLLDAGRAMTSVVDVLRKSLSPIRTHLVLEQVGLRKKAAAKFSKANEMFFSDVKLQQSTSETIALYKAASLPDGAIADLCCGIGGDSVGIVVAAVAAANKGSFPAEGQPAERSFLHVDLDPVCCQFATENLKAYGWQTPDVICDDVAHVDLAAFSAWHLDPDRRVGGNRTAAVEFGSPNEQVISSMLEQNANAMIKLAPACTLPPEWEASAELEWVGHGGECKQLVAKFGIFAGNPGERTTTVLDDDGGKVHGAITGSVDADVEFVELHDGSDLSKICGYIYEPHAAVRAAGLVNALASQLGHSDQAGSLGLKRLAVKQSYLVGESPAKLSAGLSGIGSRSLPNLLAGFEIVAASPFDRKRIRRELEAMKATHVEVKTQTKLIDALQEQKRLNAFLKPSKKSAAKSAVGDGSTGHVLATVIAVKLRDQLVAIVGRRI